MLHRHLTQVPRNVHDARMAQVGDRFARAVVARPRRVVALALLLVVAALPLVLRLQLDTELGALLPIGAPEAAAFSQYRRAFGEEERLVLLVEGAPEQLPGFAEHYATALRTHPEVAEVQLRVGRATVELARDHLFDLLTPAEIEILAARTTDPALAQQARRLRALLSAPGGSAMAPLLIADPLELLPMIEARLSAGLAVDRSGYFRSTDGRALLLLVRPRFPASDFQRTRGLLRFADEQACVLGATVGVPVANGSSPSVGFTGSYAYAVSYRDTLHRDSTRSTALSAAAVLLLFALLLGALRVIPLVALPLGISMWLTVAWAALVYGRINAVSLAFGTLLLSIGIDLPIQLYSRLREQLAMATSDTTAVVERTLATFLKPAVLATLGPAAVFFACGISRYPGLGQLGQLAGFGLLINLLAMVGLFPALLVILPVRWWRPTIYRIKSGSCLARATDAMAHHPRLFLAIAIAAAAIAIPVGLRLRVEPELISLQPPSLAVVQVQKELEARFHTQRPLIALLHHADPERALELAEAWRTEAERLRQSGLLNGYQSVATLLPPRSEQQHRRARFERLAPERMALSLRQALAEAGFDLVPFEPFLARLHKPASLLSPSDLPAETRLLIRSLLHDDGEGRTVATVLFPAPERAAEAQAELERFAAAAPERGTVTGVPVLEQLFRRVIKHDVVRVTLASIAAVTLLLVVAYRRWRPIVAVLTPLALAWLAFPALLVGLGQPLNLFNLLTVPLVVGYGIDDHIFLLHRRLDRPGAPLGPALAAPARAIVITSLSTIAGFAGLAVAEFDGLRQLGIAGAAAVALCLFAALAVLPALLQWLIPRPAGW